MRLHTLRLIFMFVFYQVIIYGQQVKMSYQAVFRDGSGLLLEEKTVQVEISILDGNGQVKYAETHQIKTNAQGLGTLRIGEGTAQSGKLEGIEWGKGQFTMRTRLPEYNLESSSPILSVPYAVNSGIADSLRNFKFKPIADGKQKGELLSWDGKQWMSLKSGKPGEVLTIGEDGTTSWSSLKIGRDTICPDSLIDIDGNRYGTVKIGNQCWMREDLRVSRFNDGTPIPFLTADKDWENAGKNGVPAVSANGSFYLYNWYAAIHPRGICPSGWHVPTSLEQESLIAYFGGKGSAFGGLTSVGPGGFAGLPGGYRYYDGDFYDLGSVGVWWSSSESSSDSAWYLYLNHDYGIVYRDSNSKENGLSVRCLRD
jgi:uncharacterized protein (TIGR02145 family)